MLLRISLLYLGITAIGALSLPTSSDSFFLSGNGEGDLFPSGSVESNAIRKVKRGDTQGNKSCQPVGTPKISPNPALISRIQQEIRDVSQLLPQIGPGREINNQVLQVISRRLASALQQRSPSCYGVRVTGAMDAFRGSLFKYEAWIGHSKSTVPEELRWLLAQEPSSDAAKQQARLRVLNSIHRVQSLLSGLSTNKFKNNQILQNAASQLLNALAGRSPSSYGTDVIHQMENLRGTLISFFIVIATSNATVPPQFLVWFPQGITSISPVQRVQPSGSGGARNPIVQVLQPSTQPPQGRATSSGPASFPGPSRPEIPPPPSTFPERLPKQDDPAARVFEAIGSFGFSNDGGKDINDRLENLVNEIANETKGRGLFPFKHHGIDLEFYLKKRLTRNKQMMISEGVIVPPRLLQMLKPYRYKNRKKRLEEETIPNAIRKAASELERIGSDRKVNTSTLKGISIELIKVLSQKTISPYDFRALAEFKLFYQKFLTVKKKLEDSGTTVPPPIARLLNQLPPVIH